jgi:hypothetical protein
MSIFSNAEELVLSILKQAATPLSRIEIFERCQTRGAYRDWQKNSGVNEISNLLKKLSAKSSVVEKGKNEGGSKLWGISQVPPSETQAEGMEMKSAEKNDEIAEIAFPAIDPNETTREFPLAADPDSPMPGTIETFAGDPDPQVFALADFAALDREIEELAVLLDPPCFPVLIHSKQICRALEKVHVNLRNRFPETAQYLLDAVEYIRATHP